MLSLILLSTTSFLACFCSDRDSGSSDSTGIIDESPRPLPPVSVAGSWIDRCSYALSIKNGIGDYYLGMARTGDGDDGWYGENCGKGSVCHPTNSTGVTLTSVHPDCGGGGIDDIVAGSTTLFYQDLEADLTYVVVDAATGECWTWGQDVTYYAAVGCTAI